MLSGFVEMVVYTSYPRCLPVAAGAAGSLTLEPAGEDFSLTQSFTHFRLHLQIECLALPGPSSEINEPGWRWFAPPELAGIGLPQPIRRALGDLLPGANRISD